MKEFNKKFKQKKAIPTKRCSCGREVKQRTRRNYPFGVNSDARTVRSFRCQTCEKLI